MVTPGERTQRRGPSRRLPLLLPAALSLFIGVWAGLWRLDWPLPLPRLAMIADHGPLMVCGFLGTLISLERAVALGRPWAYGGPGFAGLGVLLLILGAPWEAAGAAFALGSLVFVAASAWIIRRQRSLATVTMLAGAIFWLAGNIFWVREWPTTELVRWWIAFLLLTIAAERLELSRFAGTSRMSQTTFVAAVVIAAAGTALAPFRPVLGDRLAGAAMVVMTFWLVLYDIARRTLRATGLPRFTAVCVLSGSLWLGVSGVLLLIHGRVYSGPIYDGILHSFFLGFLFPLIFGHAPIIFPAVLGVALPFRRAFYVHLALLHLSLAARVLGDLSPGPLRAWGGLFNAIAILVFFLNTALAIHRGRRGRAAPAAPPAVHGPP